MKAKILDMGKGFDNSLRVTFSLPLAFADDIRALMDGEVSIEVKKWRNPRSKDANALMWCVCQELADALKIPKEEVYRKAIKDIGEYVPLPIKAEAVEAFSRNWASKGIGWFAETVDDSKIPGYKLVFAYYGSSTYDTKQMSVLLNYLVDEAEQIGIVLKAGAELEERAKELGL